MYHFFVSPSQIGEKEIYIEGKDVNHIKNVLRMKIGEELSIGNGVDGNEYRCSVSAFEEERVILNIHFIKRDGVEAPAEICLFQGLPKNDKMELIIQKCVELGVCEIVPVSMKRCVVKLDEKKEKSKRERWQSISEAAAKQSKRAVIPQIGKVMTMKEAIGRAKEFDLVILPYECADSMEETRKVLEEIKPGMKIAIFIGPEGGFEEEEVLLATDAGAKTISLGKRILRTETAGFTTLAWILYRLEVMG